MTPLGLKKSAVYLRKFIYNVIHKTHGRFFSGKVSVNEGPAFIIKKKIDEGKLKVDNKQLPIVQSLQEVYENVKGYSPNKIMSKPPKGLYIYGSVGSGKTMLMDIFYQSLQVKGKRRSHFNNFMVDVHSRIHEHNKKLRSKAWSNKSQPADPIAPVAKSLIKEAWLLCFDEFQVTDIADAMILKRLFTELFEYGMVMVATSNRAPNDLYKHGLQRVNFVPFIQVLEKHCKVVGIRTKDYRTTTKDKIDNHYILLDEPGARSEMENAYNRLCNEEKKSPGPMTLNILGHKVSFKNTCGRILYASFDELCDRPLSPADYIQIAKHFDTVFIKDVPVMNLNSRNQLRRFILLIDTLYDKRVRIKISAAAPPESLFSGVGGKGLNSPNEIMDDLGIEKGSENAKSSLFSGSEEMFAFERTISRIIEMCSNTYWTQNKKQK